jgi:hypothetical protein
LDGQSAQLPRGSYSSGAVKSLVLRLWSKQLGRKKQYSRAQSAF